MMHEINLNFTTPIAEKLEQQAAYLGKSMEDLLKEYAETLLKKISPEVGTNPNE